MNICVIGCGYVGLVTGTVFADLGNDVICVDLDREKIDKLNNGKMPIYEPGLEEMVLRNVSDGRLEFTLDLTHGIQDSEIIFICVNTPPKDNGETDQQYRACRHGLDSLLNRIKIILLRANNKTGNCGAKWADWVDPDTANRFYQRCCHRPSIPGRKRRTPGMLSI